jgi:predicted nucleotidyltransferase
MNRSGYIEQIKNVIKQTVPEAEVILYGSEARGDTHADSDIDLLILINKDNLTYNETVAITNPLYELELQGDCKVNISPLVYTRKQWYDRPFRTPFYINVMNEGVRIQ